MTGEWLGVYLLLCSVERFVALMTWQRVFVLHYLKLLLSGELGLGIYELGLALVHALVGRNQLSLLQAYKLLLGLNVSILA